MNKPGIFARLYNYLYKLKDDTEIDKNKNKCYNYNNVLIEKVKSFDYNDPSLAQFLEENGNDNIHTYFIILIIKQVIIIKVIIIIRLCSYQKCIKR